MTSSSQTSEYGVSRGSDCSRRQRRNWSPSRKLVRIHTHSGWNSYLLTSKRSEMIFFSAWVFAKLWLRLCQTSCCLCWSRLCWAHCSQTRAGFSQKEEHSWTWNSLIQAASGVSGILRWRIGTTDTILSLMVSVPYRYLLVFSVCTVHLVAMKSIGILSVVLLKMMVVQLTTLKKDFVMWDDAKDIQGVVDGFWPPLGTFSDNIPYDIRFGSKHPKIH